MFSGDVPPAFLYYYITKKKRRTENLDRPGKKA
jgi:hypothetical protein